ncbi:MAG: helix-turn-helix domain-containing protein [Candidatus Bipolaricaulota bacterium]
MDKCRPEQMEALAQHLRMLSHPVRLRSLALLLSAGGGLCVCELADVLELPQYTVSRHLQALARAGWVVGEHDGPWVYYKPVTSPLLKALGPSLSPAVEDEERLRERLLLRERGRCVVGPKDTGRA